MFSKTFAVTSVVAIALATALSSTPSVASAQEGGIWAANRSTKAPGKYADVNGLKLYYEVHGGGAGRPLIMLHGGLGAGSMFGPNLPELAKGRQVITVDLQGHGRTADIDRPIDPRLMADDVAGLIRHLRLERPDVLGYSLGGGVAMWVGIKHPQLVNKLVLASIVLRNSAYYPELRAQQVALNGSFADQMKGTPMYDLYMSVAPRTQDFPRLLDKLGDLMRKEFDYSKEFATITAPTLLIVGDAEMAPVSHTVEAFELLGGSKRDGGWDNSGVTKHGLAVLPRLTHYNIFQSPLVAAAAISFLDAK